MKAISPSLPTSVPARADSSSAPSAADEAFGAVIAAALGVVQPTPMSPAPARQDHNSRSNSDDRAADRIESSRDARSAQAHDADAADGTSSSAKPDDATSSAPAGQAKADDASGTATTHPVATAGAKNVDGSSAALDRAATALAKALADDATKPAAGAKVTADATAKLPAGKAVPIAGAPAAQNPLLAAAMTEGTKVATPTATNAPAPAVAPALASTAKDSLPSAPAPGDPATATAQTPVAAGVSSSGLGQAVTVAPVTPGVVQPQPQPQPQPAKVAVNAAPTTAGDPNALTDQSQLATAATNAHGGAAHHDAGTDLSNSGGSSAKAGSDASVLQPATTFDAALQAAAPPAPAAATPAAQPVAVPVPQGSVPQQIVQIVAPLRSAGDGNYTLSLQLHPADLGPVTVHVAVNDGVMSVQLVPDQSHGRDALTGSLSDLRNQLQAGGVRVGDVGVSMKASLSQQQNGQTGGQNGNQNGQVGQNTGQFGQQSSHQHAQSSFAQHDQGGYDGNANRQPAFSGNGDGHRGQQGRLHEGAVVVDRSVSATVPASDDAALDVRI